MADRAPTCPCEQIREIMRNTTCHGCGRTYETVAASRRASVQLPIPSNDELQRLCGAATRRYLAAKGGHRGWESFFVEEGVAYAQAHLDKQGGGDAERVENLEIAREGLVDAGQQMLARIKVLESVVLPEIPSAEWLGHCIVVRKESPWRQDTEIGAMGLRRLIEAQIDKEAGDGK